MTEHSAESTARNATVHAARISAVEIEADSVAVAVKGAGTNRTKKQSPNPGVVFLWKEKTRRGIRVGGVCVDLILVPAPAPVGNGLEKKDQV